MERQNKHTNKKLSTTNAYQTAKNQLRMAKNIQIKNTFKNV